jgi:cytochrome c-type biogenesis protein CcmH/NrfG
MYDAMIADAEAAIAVNPQSARGYLYLAQANANLGNLLDAQMYYEKAEEQARAAGDAELEAFARVQMAYLYQQMMALPTATPQAP